MSGCKSFIDLVVTSIAHLGHNLLWTGYKEKRQHEVGIAICKSLDNVIENILHHLSERLIAADICKTRVISVYNQQKNVFFSEKEKLYIGLTKLRILEKKT